MDGPTRAAEMRVMFEILEDFDGIPTTEEMRFFKATREAQTFAQLAELFLELVRNHENS